MKYACLFGASSAQLDAKYYNTAFEMGSLLAANGWGLVFGGGDAGLMGSAARGIKHNGGCLIGVIPKRLNMPGIAFLECDELLITDSMHERKARMEELASAYIAMPGGFGTLEELLEVITLKQLGYHNNPIAILNQDGFFTHLLNQFEECFSQHFSNPIYAELYNVSKTPIEIIEYIDTYIPAKIMHKIDAQLENI